MIGYWRRFRIAGVLQTTSHSIYWSHMRSADGSQVMFVVVHHLASQAVSEGTLCGPTTGKWARSFCWSLGIEMSAACRKQTNITGDLPNFSQPSETSCLPASRLPIDPDHLPSHWGHNTKLVRPPRRLHMHHAPMPTEHFNLRPVLFPREVGSTIGSLQRISHRMNDGHITLPPLPPR